jgi:hypothetical protein
MHGQHDVTTPEHYIEALEEPRRSDIVRIDALIREIAPDLEPHIQSGMIGYGTYHYRYASGREGDWFRIGLASNKNYISLYCCGLKDGDYVANAFREALPKAKIGKSCVTFKRVEDLDPEALRSLIRETAHSDFAM